MTACNPTSSSTNWLERVLERTIRWVIAHPRFVIVGATLLLIASLFLAATQLEYHTQRNDLMSSHKDYQQRWNTYLQEFGDDDDLVILLEGQSSQLLRQAVDAFAAKLQEHPDRFDRLFAKADLRSLQDRALLYLSLDEIRTIQARLEPMNLLLGPLAPMTWRTLTLDSMLMKTTWSLEQLRDGRPVESTDLQLLQRLVPIARSAQASLQSENHYQSPWSTVLDRPVDSQQTLAEPHYCLNADGTLAFLVVRPKKLGSSFTPAAEAIAFVRDLIRDQQANFPDIRFGLTGLPVLENDEMLAAQRDSNQAGWLALLGVAVLYLVVYRSLRYPFLTVVTLLTGTIWALGWLTLTVGHLNLLSATFAVMLIGMGDYGVLWIARFETDRSTGISSTEAMLATARHAGPSIVTAAMTTSLAFFATMLADFQGVVELGWIAGCGVLLCAVACFTVMPAMLILSERRNERRATPQESPTIVPITRAAALAAWLPFAARRPRWVLAGAVAIAFVSAISASKLTYDHNLLNMQDPSLDSVAWERVLVDRVQGAGWHALSMAETPEQAIALKAKYEQLPEVGLVTEVASLIPAQQSEKLPLLRQIHDLLLYIPAPKDLPPLPPVDVPQLLTKLQRAIDRLATLPKQPNIPAELPAALADFAQQLRQTDPQLARQRLNAMQTRMVRDLSTDLNRLKSVTNPRPIAIADLPTDLRDRYIGKSGVWLVRAFAKASLWDFDALTQFVAAARTVDPQVTGKPFGTLEGLRTMKAGFQWAGLYALIAITLVLLADFRQLQPTLLALVPLALGVLMSMGILALCGIALNPANLIALPLIVGVGVDNGVHVLHDYRSGNRKRPYRLGSAVGRGILVAALTTMLGFGTLMIGSHRGQSSLGLTLTLGVGCCMLASLLVLPAILRWLDERRLNSPTTIPTKPLPHPKRLAA
ncbi:MMPL family transporter [Tuwongella immobilis]|uniref:SSD domain-containing protein n=1 Tax=Tuwongella immobilis TaxID=692036 RepID=A0A6C2YJR9_9BACT|nr:MMPL family transporter [Tuwongella immobilis]VIP01353.1 hopanoid biosynthesis associated rnd transporter like protein : Protein export membrane protein, SecD/SecF family, putative OS=Blastopirellula marina DSM 3645 GN=DSM3645_16385 PE=4 SV=1: MMPL: Sterol-sensing [Tuwongella immobilis]VTR98152.1 hopanoid biosynthesis associated rnd transporter like protein : Protein export membrane protein, SecD/SecF family, putative OS=Blastopirellula marina DSM 3645 GN=DSM3645_16385 PE=4 SV=1: MMPL: Sterol-